MWPLYDILISIGGIIVLVFLLYFFYRLSKSGKNGGNRHSVNDGAWSRAFGIIVLHSRCDGGYCRRIGERIDDPDLRLRSPSPEYEACLSHLDLIAVIQRDIVLADLYSVQFCPVCGMHIRKRIGIEVRIEINDAVAAADLRNIPEADCALSVPPDERFAVHGQIQPSHRSLILIFQIRHKKSPFAPLYCFPWWRKAPD